MALPMIIVHDRALDHIATRPRFAQYGDISQLLVPTSLRRIIARQLHAPPAATMLHLLHRLHLRAPFALYVANNVCARALDYRRSLSSIATKVNITHESRLKMHIAERNVRRYDRRFVDCPTIDSDRINLAKYVL